MDLKEENALNGIPEEHWYYVSKGRALTNMVDAKHMPKVLDVGAGSGVFPKAFIADGFCDTAICVDPNYSDAWLQDNQHPSIEFVRGVDHVDADLVTMIDVLEHVDDDVELLSLYADKAAPGTTFLLSVPAFQYLWSSHDEYLDHRRRYTLKMLRNTAERSGLEPVKMRYFFGALFPAAAASRIADRLLSRGKEAKASAMGSVPGPLNKALIGIHDIERMVMMPWNKLFGVSAFCVAVKPDN
ncbi:MAG: class I SAM-dependent methyltransferase [Pseudomonadota bacterium]